MKKTKLIGALLAGVMAFSGIPQVTEPMIVTASAASALAAPTGVKAAVTDTTVKLSWNKVTGADAYRVYKYNASTKKYETYKNVSGTNCTVKDLSAGNTYKFKVAALVKSGTSYKAQTSTAAQTVKTKLAAPKNVKATAGASSVKLSWNKVTGASAYRIYTYDSASKTYKTYKSVSGTSYTVSGLSSGTYQFKVAALVKSGSKYTAQAQSAAVKATVKSSSSSSKAAAPVTFPAFGTKKSTAIKAFDFVQSYDVGEVQSGFYGYGGYAKVNGKETMIMLFFNSSDQFFYGAALVPTDAMSFSTALSNMKKARGDDYITVNSGGVSLYEWVDETAQTGEFLSGSTGAESFLYGIISMKYAPDSMKNSNANIYDSLKDISSIM